jgi:hypothetical protein
VLSRVLKFCGRWRALADHVKVTSQSAVERVSALR